MRLAPRVLALAALVLAAGAFMAGAAQAEPIEPPSFGLCGNGNPERAWEFSDPACTSTTGTLAYYWTPTEGFPEAYFGKGKTTIYLPGGAASCTGVSAPGVYAAPKEVANISFHFKGCTLAGHACKTAGAENEGEVQTSVLDGLLGYAQSRKGKRFEQVTALELSPQEAGAPVAEFSCGETEVALRGELVPRMYVKKRSETLELKVSKGQNVIASLEGVTPSPLEAAVDGGAYAPVAVKAKLAWPFSNVLINTVYSRP